MSGIFTLISKGIMAGHQGSVNQIVTSPKLPDKILSSSQDNTLILWNIHGDYFGKPIVRLYGHSSLITDVCLSFSGEYALSGSWDETLRLWDLKTEQTVRNFQPLTRDIVSVTMSPDDRQILYASHDKFIKYSDMLGKCTSTVQDNPHIDYVACVRYSPNLWKPIIVSCGWDRMVKVWDVRNFTNCSLKHNCLCHTDKVNIVSVSPDGSITASGGKDCKVMLWDLNYGSHLYTFYNNERIEALSISPTRRWVAAAIGTKVKVWDIDTKQMIIELVPSDFYGEQDRPKCMSVDWSADGNTLFAGYADEIIRVWKVVYKKFNLTPFPIAQSTFSM